MNGGAVRQAFEEGVAGMEQALAAGCRIAWLSLAASVVALTATICAIFVRVIQTETTLLRAWDALQKLRKIIKVFALEPVRRAAARSFSEEGEILCESLVRILTGLNRDLEGLLRATAAMRPYFGENTKDEKFPHLLIQLNKALDVQVRSAEEVRAIISQVRHLDF